MSANQVETSRPTRHMTILECPQCQSHRASILNTRAPMARCADCGATYKIHTVDVEPVHDEPQTPSDAAEGQLKPKRGGHKQQKLDPIPAQPLSLKDLGTLTNYIETVIDGGPKAIRAANKEAARLSQRYGITVNPQWLLLTPWLDTTYRNQGGGTGIVTKDAPRRLGNGRFAKVSGKQSEERVTRARMRYALRWRAAFLAAYSVTVSKVAAAAAAKVGVTTVDTHYREDKDFALQCDTARAHGVDLLHTRVMQRALEGDLEPVYFQGVKVDHVRRFSDRIQIEMLRAHLPKTFKTPGLHGAVTVNTGDQVLCSMRRRG